MENIISYKYLIFSLIILFSSIIKINSVIVPLDPQDEKYRMIYEMNKDGDRIRILGKEFVRNNKNKGKLIYKNKKYPLLEHFQINNFTEDKLIIKILLNNDSCNRSFMFKDCSLLQEIKILNNKDNKLFDNKNSVCIEPYNKKDDYIYNKEKGEFEMTII